MNRRPSRSNISIVGRLVLKEEVWSPLPAANSACDRTTIGCRKRTPDPVNSQYGIAGSTHNHRSISYRSDPVRCRIVDEPWGDSRVRRFNGVAGVWSVGVAGTYQLLAVGYLSPFVRSRNRDRLRRNIEQEYAIVCRAGWPGGLGNDRSVVCRARIGCGRGCDSLALAQSRSALSRLSKDTGEFAAVLPALQQFGLSQLLERGLIPLCCLRTLPHPPALHRRRGVVGGAIGQSTISRPLRSLPARGEREGPAEMRKLPARDVHSLLGHGERSLYRL
jgi:hypothetical protein